LFGDPTRNVAVSIVNAVLRASKNDPTALMTGATLVMVVQQLLPTLARYGRTATEGTAFASFENQLSAVLTRALAVAATELGRHLELPALPGLLAAIIAEWAQGKADASDAAAVAFNTLFIDLAQRAVLRAVAAIV
jgi:hypothetical protein